MDGWDLSGADFGISFGGLGLEWLIVLARCFGRMELGERFRDWVLDVVQSGTEQGFRFS